jgi:hypothetical protein
VACLAFVLPQLNPQPYTLHLESVVSSYVLVQTRDARIRQDQLAEVEFLEMILPFATDDSVAGPPVLLHILASACFISKHLEYYLPKLGGQIAPVVGHGGLQNVW